MQQSLLFCCRRLSLVRNSYPEQHREPQPHRISPNASHFSIRRTEFGAEFWNQEGEAIAELFKGLGSGETRRSFFLGLGEFKVKLAVEWSEVKFGV